MKISSSVFFLLFFLFISSLTAQKSYNKITITGTVLDGNDCPIVDAIVMVDNRKTNIRTDSAGNYKIKVKADASRIGIFTFGNGYLEEEINGRDRINVSFKTVAYRHYRNNGAGEEDTYGRSYNSPDYGNMELHGRSIPSGEEAVDVGYATIKKKYLTTDISYIDGTNKKYASYNSVYDMIQREVSGVMVFDKTIVIQGTGSFGAVTPLLIIDGAYASMESLDDIQPMQVKSISVLKGTSAAIYGSRGFGGAIIVRTKSYDDY
jgi:TonB-dependent SusC/RagA subfamily outer membrane receptor